MNSTSAYFFINKVIEVIETWWWVVIPFLLWKPLSFLYLWWRIDGFLGKQKKVLLEIRLPREIEKPMRAMEAVISSLHASIYQPAGDLWEKWIDGQVQLSLAIEMVSIDGQPRFFIRMPTQYRDAIESSFYAQYPEIEIEEVDDYTKHIPQTIPNKDWDLFGCDYKLIRDDYYPIKTYFDFETEREKEKEQVIDPIAALLEGMTKLKKGEQLWVQMILEPVGDADLPKSLSEWSKSGKSLRDKLARRSEPSPSPSKPIIQEALEILITGKVEEQKKEEKEIIPPEMKLTPGEREILSAIERKMSKPIFQTTLRFIFLGRKEVWFKPKFRVVFSYLNQYATNNLNALFPNGKTLTKIKKSIFLPFLNFNFIRDRRKYLRCRKLLRNYVRRLTPFFPRSGGTFMLNTEEVASLFHFPSERSVPSPGLSRIETKKKGTPSSLPSE